MKTPMQSIQITSIYKNKQNELVPLPKRMAICTPDTHRAIFAIDKDLRKKGGKLILSDLFRSYEMQLQAHNDFVSKRKKAFSPAPGGSMHEAGRGMDIDLKAIKIPLKDFWTIAAKHGFFPVISKPSPGASEAWHFDCRGSHQTVYEYYKNKKGTNFPAYTAMAVSAILAIDVQVDIFEERQKQAQLQAGLIRLGRVIGNIDGHIGKNTQRAIEEVGIEFNPLKIDAMILQVENLLQAKFPMEFRVEV